MYTNTCYDKWNRQFDWSINQFTGQTAHPGLLTISSAAASSRSVEWTGPGGLHATLGQLPGFSPVTTATGADASFWLEVHAKVQTVAWDPCAAPRHDPRTGASA